MSTSLLQSVVGYFHCCRSLNILFYCPYYNHILKLNLYFLMGLDMKFQFPRPGGKIQQEPKDQQNVQHGINRSRENRSNTPLLCMISMNCLRWNSWGISRMDSKLQTLSGRVYIILAIIYFVKITCHEKRLSSIIRKDNIL